VLLPSALRAQFTPPNIDTYKWTGATNTDWSEGGNWVQGSAPAADNDNANVHFTDDPAASGPEAEVSDIPNKTLRSLWFDAAVGYTLDGGDLTLGSGLDNDLHMIAVRKNADTSDVFNWGAETNINNAITVAASDTPLTRWIENQSEGGLGLNGNLNLGASNLLITGGQATRFGGELSGTGGITITGPSGTSIFTPTHLILQGNNTDTWSGALDIEFNALGIVKSASALSSGLATVHSGGTLAWRSHIGSNLFTTAAPQPILVEGTGIVRQDAVLPVGAIYNDGGLNLVTDAFTLTGDTWFGSRGDISGALALIGQISDGGEGHAFIKVGPGLIILADTSLFTGTPPAPEDRNTWGRTILRDGVLRVSSEWALPDANLELDGGVLELGWADFSRDLGTGTDEVQWTGDGGFSAADGDFSVSLNSGDALTWGQQYFVQDGHALLLGSRYSDDATVTFSNALDLGTGSSHREIRVAKTARATLSGTITGTNASTGLLKTGDGLLSLTGLNTYKSNTVIEGGALRGTIPTGSHIVLAGGVLGLDDDFTRGRFTAAPGGRIIWQGSGGFAAYDGDRIVRIDNATTTHIGWGWNNFVPHGKELRFGHSTATGTVIWDRALHLGNQMRTIRVERGQNSSRADVVFNRELKTDGINVGLRLVGNGRADIAVANPNFSGTIQIFGAELRLHSAGSLSATPVKFLISNGGILSLDNIGTHDNPGSGGSNHNNRIHDLSDIALNAGTLVYRGSLTEDSSERIGALTLEFGANRLEMPWNLGELDVAQHDTTLHAQRIERTATSRSVLSLYGLPTTTRNYLLLDESANAYGINDGDGAKVIPWVFGDSFFTPYTDANEQYSIRTIPYDGVDEANWGPAHNIAASIEGISLSASRALNALHLSEAIDLNGHTLTIHSGALASAARLASISGSENSHITTASGRPLYLHSTSSVSIKDRVAIIGGMDLVAHHYQPHTRQPAEVGGGIPIGQMPPPGNFLFQSNATHLINSLYIQSGILNLIAGTLSVSGEIFVGDGAGIDVLMLAPNRRNQLITPNPNVFPKVTLHGTPYDPQGPEYGGDQAILQMGGNTKQRLSELHIQDRGTIDWVGGEVSRANILYLDKLTFSGPDAILFMRNWYEYEDYFLINKVWFNSQTEAQRQQLLSQVHFEGYENFPVIYRNYDASQS